MKIITYSLVSVLAFLSIFTVGYLVNNRFVSFWGDNLRTALVSRFVEPQEVKSLYDLLDKLPSQGSGPMTISSDGQSLIYYDPETGYLHKIDPLAAKDQDSSLQKLRPYLSHLQWSQTRDKILTSDGAETIFYNLVSGESKVLPQNIQITTLSPSGDKLVYIENDPESNNSWLSISDTDTGSSKKLLSVAPGNWTITWIDGHTLSLAYNNYGVWSLLVINTDNGQLTRILSNLSNLEINWSHDGRSLLYSYSDGDKIRLFYHNVTTGKDYQIVGPDRKNDRGSSIPTPNQNLVGIGTPNCIWSTDDSSVFCSVNKNSPQDTEDDGFVLLKIGSTPQNLQVNNTSKIKAENLLLSADEKYLFFRNSYTGNFYRLRIEVE